MRNFLIFMVQAEWVARAAPSPLPNRRRTLLKAAPQPRRGRTRSMKRVETKVATAGPDKSRETATRPRYKTRDEELSRLSHSSVFSLLPASGSNRSRNQIARTQTFTRFTFAGIALSRATSFGQRLYLFTQAAISLATIYDNEMRGDSWCLCFTSVAQLSRVAIKRDGGETKPLALNGESRPMERSRD